MSAGIRYSKWHPARVDFERRQRHQQRRLRNGLGVLTFAVLASWLALFWGGFYAGQKLDRVLCRAVRDLPWLACTNTER